PTPSLSICSTLPPARAAMTSSLSLHDALPILDHLLQLVLETSYVVMVLLLPYCVAKLHRLVCMHLVHLRVAYSCITGVELLLAIDRKSTRLNSSHVTTSYAVFCLKKKSAGPSH